MTIVIDGSPQTPSDRASDPATHESAQVRVRVWFGPHLIAQYAAHTADAAAYAWEMPCRFHGIRVTLGTLERDQDPQRLPARRLWPLTVG